MTGDMEGSDRPMMEFLYFPEDKSEYIPAVLMLILFIVAAAVTMVVIIKASRKEEKKTEETFYPKDHKESEH
ncbi:MULTISPECIES: hypothetical protein [Halobacillus]|uniref:Uncharacterized protein n=1 Tax=Halobacillus halophilus (strain ATCC 35676 / DSM 2266 / JCM 20832 / KCTC 3685 / LMG 17431 / NBRC 102448 / NCIMB 2269) TaxID=866895 RepID=I0JQ13_HALH3|nr:hypothetical protein [Halobacillus halophilus]ASF40252.1 hypothetical protein CEH05_14320 [Halobacillus halophilus]CCG46233.1 hypothetical protein HBHAL_3891 [Halobacillus halophilus DSM 2266]